MRDDPQKLVDQQKLLGLQKIYVLITSVRIAKKRKKNSVEWRHIHGMSSNMSEHLTMSKT